MQLFLSLCFSTIKKLIVGFTWGILLYLKIYLLIVLSGKIKEEYLLIEGCSHNIWQRQHIPAILGGSVFPFGSINMLFKRIILVVMCTLIISLALGSTCLTFEENIFFSCLFRQYNPKLVSVMKCNLLMCPILLLPIVWKRYLSGISCMPRTSRNWTNRLLSCR